MYFTSIDEIREIRKGFLRDYLKSSGSPMKTVRGGRNKDIMWLKRRALLKTEYQSPYFRILQEDEKKISNSDARRSATLIRGADEI